MSDAGRNESQYYLDEVVDANGFRFNVVKKEDKAPDPKLRSPQKEGISAPPDALSTNSIAQEENENKDFTEKETEKQKLCELTPPESARTELLNIKKAPETRGDEVRRKGQEDRPEGPASS